MRYLKLSTSQLCIIPTMLPHKTIYENAAVTRIVFSNSYISDHLSEYALSCLPEGFNTKPTVSGGGEIEKIVKAVCRSIESGGERAYIYIFKLMRLCTPFWGGLPQIKNEHMVDILSYIGRNSKKKLSLDEIADACKITKFHVCRLVKKEMGITPVDFITFAKMRRAITMLLKTKNTVAHIGEELSFSSPKYFTRIFKEYFDVSPQKFRSSSISEKERYYLKRGETL